jgi:hypothetical protein
MQMQRADQQPPAGDPKSCLKAIAFIVRTFSVCGEVFLRTGFGERYFGNQAAAAVLLIPCFTILCPKDDPTGLIVFLIAYLCLLFSHRIDIVKRRRAGTFEHSYYNGRPIVLRWPLFRKLSEEKVKLNVEPMIAIFSGIFMMPLSIALGKLVVLIGLGMMFTTGLTQAYQHARVIDMRDAYIEQRTIASRFRGGV